MKATKTVEESKIRGRNGQFRISLRRKARQQRRRQRLFDALAFDLIFEGAAFRNDHDSSHRMKQYPVSLGNLIGATQVNSAGLVLQSLQTAGAHDRLQIFVQQLEEVSWRVVKDY